MVFTSILTGSLTVASLTTSGPLTLQGHVSVKGGLAIGSSGLTLSDAATLAAASATTSGPLTVTGASHVAIKGTLTAAGAISVTGSSTLQAGALTLQSDAVSGVVPTVNLDATSSIEVGSSGGHAAHGAITVDRGATLQINGSGSFAAPLVDNGTIVASTGLGLGPVSGNGVLRLGSDGPVTLTGAATGISIVFTGGDSVDLRTPGEITGTIRGFGASDAIQIDSLVTAANYATEGTGRGKLTLLDGKSVVSRLAFAGNYSGASFHLHVAMSYVFQPIYSTEILAVAPTASLGTQAPTLTAGDYSWALAQGGDWSTASNWVDGTGATATRAPGATDAVAISSPALLSGTEQAITGTGRAASLAIQGQVLLLGHVQVAGALTVGGAGFWPGCLDLDQGASLSAASAAVNAPLQVGGRSSLTIAGSLSVTGGQTDLIAIGGGTIRANALAISQSVVMADATSVIEIGHASHARAGVLTIGSDGLLSGLGTVQNAVVNNGDIAATGNTQPDFTDALQLGGLSGTGTAEIASGAVLELNGSETGNAIIFRGSDASLFLNTGNTVSVGGTLQGLQAGDRIITGAHLTGVTYTASANGSGGSLALLAGTTTLGTLHVQGSYTAASFSTADISLTSNTGATFTGSAITVASLGLGTPTLIGGSAGADVLSTGLDGAVLTGNGGSDTYSFNGANDTVRDTAAHLNGTTIDAPVAFTIDVTDLNPTIAAFAFDGTTLHVTDFNHSLGINLADPSLSFSRSAADFSLGADGHGGTQINVAAATYFGGGTGTGFVFSGTQLAIAFMSGIPVTPNA